MQDIKDKKVAKPKKGKNSEKLGTVEERRTVSTEVANIVDTLPLDHSSISSVRELQQAVFEGKTKKNYKTRTEAEKLTIIYKILQEIQYGLSDLKACKKHGIMPAHFQYWIKQYELGEIYGACQDVRADTTADRLAEVMNSDREAHDKRVWLDYTKWLTGILSSDYAPKAESNIANGTSISIVINERIKEAEQIIDVFRDE